MAVPTLFISTGWDRYNGTSQRPCPVMTVIFFYQVIPYGHCFNKFSMDSYLILFLLHYFVYYFLSNYAENIISLLFCIAEEVMLKLMS